jgi:hypothetical protein
VAPSEVPLRVDVVRRGEKISVGEAVVDARDRLPARDEDIVLQEPDVAVRLRLHHAEVVQSPVPRIRVLDGDAGVAESGGQALAIFRTDELQLSVTHRPIPCGVIHHDVHLVVVPGEETGKLQ